MPTLKLERNFSADPATVFAFISKSEHLMKWWGPEGVTIEEGTLAFSNPGPWVSTMINSAGGRFKVSGEVTLVEPPNAIVLTWAWHDENDQRGHESNVRFDVAAGENGGTIFTLTHSNLADDEAAENHNQGWTSSLKKLETLSSI